MHTPNGLAVNCHFLSLPALPFLRKTQAFLYPMVPVLVVYFLSLLLRWNISLTALRLYGLHNPEAVVDGEAGSQVDDPVV